MSEERPAIDALQRRLAYVGLGEVVLDLPEDPRRARIAIQSLADQLRRSTGAPEPEFPEDPLPTWRQAQARLIEHESQMHTKHAPWDLSLAQTESAVAGLNGLPHPPLSHVRLETSVLKSLTPDRLTQLRETLTEAAQIGVWQRGRMEDPWFGAALQSPEDAERAAAIVKSLVMSDLIQARQEIDQVCKKAGLPAPLNLDQWRARVNLMGRVYETLDVFRAEIYEAPLDDLVRATSDNAADRPGALLRTRLKRQVRGLLRPGVPPADLAVRVKAARDERAEWEELAGRAAPPNTPAQWEQASEQFMPIHRDLVWLAKVLKPTPSGQDVMTTHLDLLLERLLRLDARADRLPVTASAYIMLQPLREQGLGPLIDDLAKRGITAEDVNAEVDLIFYASLLDYLESADDGSTLSGEDQVDAAKALRRADREQLRRNRARVLRSLHRKLQRVVAKNPSQVKALYAAADAHEHDLRAVLERSPDVVKALRPALVGSPLVVPATIPERFSVKVTIVEHAGRTRTAHCIAAISHGEQTIIAGDSLRPRPMAFHAIVEDILPGDEPLTSLLDDAADLLPTYTFSTHYRAKDQRLVAPLAKIVEKARPGQTLEAHPGVLRSPRANVVVSDSPTGLPEETVEALLRHLAAGHRTRSASWSMALVSCQRSTWRCVSVWSARVSATPRWLRTPTSSSLWWRLADGLARSATTSSGSVCLGRTLEMGTPSTPRTLSPCFRQPEAPSTLSPPTQSRRGRATREQTCCARSSSRGCQAMLMLKCQPCWLTWASVWPPKGSRCVTQWEMAGMRCRWASRIRLDQAGCWWLWTPIWSH
ncbi:hypothetical protein [Ornithinimicrobium sp. INDO-MA30-4]|uniref:hypothetical protein n=1 Tax=Ornithinimicrobium sp. INDO-MA30-4 TaxID=2908651 RepID=UPI001F484C3B|nr:hypothetical protein [Ornithinimicrobium sp. INDO-MA30-4]UJH70559.1 hypothetical protein L0A91_16175 [Ornithinimicrobium sp. INDO-MA30-4]